ncbi:chorismatase [Krasilnikovia cinnamomea]|uniref:Chorismatase n=1 Tax=Krasilnikovia cinnamomea TaxID=349313 RepID=A0A4Q7ZSL8_9ACTN|nr:FkbO/Hyg5 family chorismatase [Krasilnikovia cinnamomea]RZU54188.1 chorismatase [Krasilnikovia cinnamomea]
MTQTRFADSGPSLEYAPRTTLSDFGTVADPAAGGYLLGQINYTTAAADPTVSGTGSPVLDLHMTADPGDAFSELWITRDPVHSGTHDGVVFAHDGEYLLCAGRVPQARTYAAATEHAYLAALNVMRDLGYRHCYRMWNFVNQINAPNAEGLETYRDFCLGRANAFEKTGFGEDVMPAATGIGSLGGGIGFYFLSGRSARPTMIENPEQMSAYHYPRRYGPKAPKFARAAHLATAGSGHVYVSGTASITGHKTRYAGDIVRQTHVSLQNIARVIGATNLWEHGIPDGHFLSNLDHVKVYVRHAEHIPVVRQICTRAFSTAAEIRYLNVDICRSDLLVEIEGIAY